MTVHRPHPISGPFPYVLRYPDQPDTLVNRQPVDDSKICDDPTGAVLYDGCDRCSQHAAHPFGSLDDDNLAALIEQALAGGLSYEIPEQPTRTQQLACRNIRDQWTDANAIMSRVHRITGTLPGWLASRTAPGRN